MTGVQTCALPISKNKSKKISGFMGLLEIGLVAVFMGLFLGFIFCFYGFDEDLVWLLDLDLGFTGDWFGCFKWEL